MSAGTQIVPSLAGSTKVMEAVDPTFCKIRDLIYKVCGIFQLDDKLYSLSEACGRRMKILSARSPRDYWEFLTTHPGGEAELRHLLNQITIGETCLFRSPPQLDALRKVILPEIVADKSRQITKRLRIWSAGCSTGEEPYTLAMNLLEESEQLLKGWTIQIIATDLNDHSIDAAKAGVYGEYALRHTPEYFKTKYFAAVDKKCLQVLPEVKKLIAFSRLNLQDDAKMLFLKGMDAIFCCNVLIYFDGPSKSRVIQHYYSNLNLGGYFFLGASESLMRLNDKFHLVHFPGTISYWKPSVLSLPPNGKL